MPKSSLFLSPEEMLPEDLCKIKSKHARQADEIQLKKGNWINKLDIMLYKEEVYEKKCLREKKLKIMPIILCSITASTIVNFLSGPK